MRVSLALHTLYVCFVWFVIIHIFNFSFPAECFVFCSWFAFASLFLTSPTNNKKVTLNSNNKFLIASIHTHTMELKATEQGRCLSEMSEKNAVYTNGILSGVVGSKEKIPNAR